MCACGIKKDIERAPRSTKHILINHPYIHVYHLSITKLSIVTAINLHDYPRALIIYIGIYVYSIEKPRSAATIPTIYTCIITTIHNIL